ncbi:SDR family NAD(P)-dependent oxidoreductase [Acrocarpospora catenulata]|uniref:SDR family NAD(P)-dependent oxidoreductase n=1 Tax=Acrocarpospora catenulata TaxID=2836182 RepID=UPI001BDA8E89|nr:SDR family oxidoreductase [Acrocarpospora catenulata]
MSRVILIAGAGGPAGQAAVRRFTELGDRVIGVDRSGANGCLPVDLLDLDAVRELAGRVKAEHGRVDGVVHLVGGWRGSPSFAETSLADWELLHNLLIKTLQHVTLVFEPLLRASDDGRFAIVSAKAAQKPTQGNAAYAAAKAAAEAWTLSFADALKGSSAAAAVLVVNALVHDGMRTADPGRTFKGFTDVADLAAAISGLWDRPADEVNGQRFDLTG